MQPNIFIEQMNRAILIDVRSPGEYRQGHIPGAVNVPLLDDDERKEIGTLYVQKSRQEAVERALVIVGPKLAAFNEEFKRIRKAQETNADLPFGVYCWRGGMRSNSMVWLMRTCGYEAFILDGGYKAFRNEQIRLLCNYSWRFRLLGGMTGCGKTEVLHFLRMKGEQVIDLESLASHRGSAFGHLGLEEQPTSEMFENLLCKVLLTLNPSKPVWIEAESCRIGKVQIPEWFFTRMKNAPLFIYEIPYEQRVERLYREYGSFPHSCLIRGFEKITRRLGSERTREAIEAIGRNDLKKAAAIALAYYDKSYKKSLKDQGNPIVYKVTIADDDPKTGADSLLSF